MNLSDTYFTKLQELYSESLTHVQMVKLGDILFEFETRKLTIEESIKTLENEIVNYKNENIVTMVDWCDWRIVAYQQCLNIFSDMYYSLKNKKI